jgi:ATP-dependent RNA helicase DeaD
VKLAQAADGRTDAALVDLPEPVAVRDGAPRKGDRPRSSKAGGRALRSPGTADTVRLFIGAGRQSGVRPADLVGALTNEAGLTSSVIGAIEIRERFSLVEVPADAATHIVKAMRGAALRGQKVPVRVDRDHAAGAAGGR